jgi:uncharacterized membrane-anchored protein
VFIVLSRTKATELVNALLMFNIRYYLNNPLSKRTSLLSSFKLVSLAKGKKLGIWHNVYSFKTLLTLLFIILLQVVYSIDGHVVKACSYKVWKRQKTNVEILSFDPLGYLWLKPKREQI